MGKQGMREGVYCGVDVGAEELVVAVLCGDCAIQHRTFRNRAAGHRALILWLRAMTEGVVRVALEATGTYSLNLALDDADGIEVAVLNPRVVHDFARSLAGPRPTRPMRRCWRCTRRR